MTKNLTLLLSVGLLAACPSSNKGEQTFPGDTKTDVDTNAFDENGGSAEAPAELVFPKEEFRAAQPEGTEPRSFQLPTVQTFKLGGQIDVYLVEKHTLPTISADLSFEGGSVNDPSNKVGLADICMDLMGEGTKKLDKLAYRAALADIASTISTYASAETQGVSMRTLTRNLDATVALFGETLREPGFRQAELDRMQKRRLQSLKQAKASAPSVGGRLSDNVLYGAGHPFGRVETEKSLASVKVADCVRYHKSYIRPRGAKLYVVGDMTKAQVLAKFAPLLKGWSGAPKRSVKLGKPATRAGKIFFVNIPESAQSVVYVMHFGPKRTDKDYFANTMMSAILGGSFSGRVNMNLREDKGYSYGARARLGYSRNYGELVAYSSVRADATRQSILEFFKEMQNLKSGDGGKPATAAELERERNGAILSLPGQFSTSRGALGRYRNLVYYGLPLDYYNSYVENLQGVKLEEVNAAASKHLRPSDAVVLVVGDANATQIYRNAEGKDVEYVDSNGKPMTLRASLEGLVSSGELGRGKLVELDADGNLAK